MKHINDSFIDDIIKEISQKEEKNPDFDGRLKNAIQKLILARPEIHADELFKQNLRKRLVALAQYPKETSVKKSWFFYCAPLFTCFAVFGFSYHFFFTSSLQNTPLKTEKSAPFIAPTMVKESFVGKEELSKQTPVLKKSIPQRVSTPKIAPLQEKQADVTPEVNIQNDVQNNMKEDTQIIDILGNIPTQNAHNNASIPTGMSDMSQLGMPLGGVSGAAKMIQPSLGGSLTGTFVERCTQGGGNVFQSGSEMICGFGTGDCSAKDYENHICNFDEIK